MAGSEHKCSSACLIEVAPFVFRCRQTFKIHRCGADCRSWILAEDARVCTITARVVGGLEFVHQHTGGISNSRGWSVYRGNKVEPLRNSVRHQMQIISSTVVAIFAGPERQRLYESVIAKCREQISRQMKRGGKKSMIDTMSNAGLLMVRCRSQCNPPAHPNAPWLHPLAKRIHKIWTKARPCMGSIVSTQSIRHFAAAVVSIMSTGGLSINGVCVIRPHRACQAHALAPLQYRDVLRRAGAGKRSSCSSRVHKMTRRIWAIATDAAGFARVLDEV